jgi:hypothetical protein
MTLSLRSPGLTGNLAHLALWVMLAPLVGSAADYYVNSVDGADGNPGTVASPWKSIAKVNGYAFEPGDVVHFARGSQFVTGMVISRSGEPGKPITFTSYGTAAAPPRFTNPDSTALNGNAIQITGSHIIVEQLYFYDCAAPPPIGEMQPFGAAAVPAGDPLSSGAVMIAAGANHDIVRDVEITGSPLGIRVSGQHNLIARNFIHDNRAPATQPGGPVGIVVGNSSNEVSYNRIVDSGVQDKDNASIAILLDGRRYSKDDVSIHHNYSLRNGRFLEVAARAAEPRREAASEAFSVRNLRVSYNVSDEYGSFIRISVPEMSGVRLENNTIVLTRIGEEPASPRAAIDLSPIGRGVPDMLAYRNNIFFLGPGHQVSPHTDFPHDHNLYCRTDGIKQAWAILGSNASLGSGDRIANPRFIDYDTEYSRNPGSFRDLRLRNNSPAVDAGVNLGYTKDHDNNPVPTGAAPDIGAYEQGALLLVETPPKAIVEAAEPANWKLLAPKTPSNVSAAGRSYYLDSIKGSDDNPGTIAQPWRSLRSLSGRIFQPGDTIYFARGSEFIGGLAISSSGRQGSPITFTAYGSGPAPRFSNPDYGLLNGNAFQITGSYIVVDDLYFHHCATPPPGTRGGAQKIGAIFVKPEAQHVAVRNCELTKTPMTIHVYGRYCLISHNYIHDNDEWPSDVGWVAVGIMVCNSDNEVSYNLITRCWQPSATYGGGDGGAIELDDRTYPKANIFIHHNRSWANQGFLETVGGVTSIEDNIVVSYNVVDDYQSFILCGNCSNFRVENNTVIRVLNNGSWSGVFRFGRTYPASLRNNIFVVANAARVFEGRDTGTDLQMHDHNLFFGVDGTEEPQGKAVRLSDGEMVADPLFVDFANRDLHLRDGSPAIDAGINLGHSIDFENRPVPSGFAQDMGAYELRRVPQGGIERGQKP